MLLQRINLSGLSWDLTLRPKYKYQTYCVKVIIYNIVCLRLGMCFYLGRFSVVFAYIFFQNQTVREANVFKIFILNILCSASMSKYNPGRRQTRSKNNCVVTIIFGLFFQFKFFRIKMLQSLTILKSWKFC